MARPKSEDKRKALMTAAVEVILAEGLRASTAAIAQTAGVSNGSLFTYFPTKTDLYNELYIELKSDMASTAMEGVSPDSDLHDQFFQVWSNWMRWSITNPDRRKVLTMLGTCDELTEKTCEAGHQIMAGLANLVERIRVEGPLRAAPMKFVAALMIAVAETTMDFMTQDPSNAQTHSKTGFESVWRILTHNNK